MDTAPSTGFLQGLWNKISPQIPGMVNAVGSSMPGPWGQASQATGKMMQGRQKKNKQMGTQPSAGTPNNPFGNVQFGGPSATMGMGTPMGGNTGFTGGMPMGGGVSPLWSNYGGGMQPGQSPYPQNRQVMY